MLNKDKYILFMIFICACTHVHAQINLLKNGGFEQYHVCPYEVNEVKDAKYWNCIDTNYVLAADTFVGNQHCPPDYINMCGTNIFATAPRNANFYQYPRSGNGMFNVGMYDSRGDTTSVGNSYHRAYLMGHLSSILTSGQSYCVTFYVVMSNLSGYAIDHIGAYLDNGSIDTVSHCGWPLMEYTPQVYATSIISDSVSWTKIQGSFTANGTEKYITIGNFFDTAHTHKIAMANTYWSYYEVDDVSVIASNATAYAGPDVNINIGSSAWIGVDSNGNGDGMPCYWYVLGGATPIDSGGRVMVTPTTTTTYVVAMDLCGTTTYDTVMVNVAQCPAQIVATFTNTVSVSATGDTDTVHYTYTGNTFLMDSVRWNFGDGTKSNALNPVHVFTAAGTYHACVTYYSYCGSDSACGDVTVTPDGVASPRPSPGERVLLWPNPVKNELTIENAINCEVSIFDVVSGSARLTMTIKSNIETIDLSSLPSGIYIVQITSPFTGQRVVKKIVKE